MRITAENAIQEIATFRSWNLWAGNVRSNHSHVVITAPGYKPTLVRDQLKGKTTGELRNSFEIWQNRPVWTSKGDIEFLDTDDDIGQCVAYVNEAQDRKDHDPA